MVVGLRGMAAWWHELAWGTARKMSTWWQQMRTWLGDAIRSPYVASPTMGPFAVLVPAHIRKTSKRVATGWSPLCVCLLLFLIDWYKNGFHDLVAATLEASIPAGLCICPELLCLVTPRAVLLGGLFARAISGTRGTLKSLYLCQGCLWWCVLPFILSSSLCAMAWSWTAVLAVGARGPSVCLWLELAVDACCALGLRDSLLAGVSLVVGLVVFAQIRVLADWHHHRM